MQARQLHNRFTANLINNTTNFINNNFDFNLKNEPKTQFKQMPLMQLQIFAEQSFQKNYSVVITMLNDNQLHGKFISQVNQNKYVFKVSKNLFSIVTLGNLKSINLI
ncbi:hypothetical protein [Companilactobacillus futsaii]|uniref:Uncharacterized protein n=2 Tax=Companilactobacillus futsaii TaxID=938155 RepID=A0A5B7SX51_9LACO|nr:hypothetical protein [Companilactobacillus futsaii]KRK91487.1 hypothetical protein FC88_GL001288 [Companilactobacillus futsaii JCM 17355]QCX24476.1 hypothetical protein FG051_04885 [Companilactobacillus futsaii]